ncbi:MAG: hypothetical protein M1833_004850 [Piccolia ochrophora]|nr:MAG: hypothetical protein M1833_004850 [Piccolia ochrophora]
MAPLPERDMSAIEVILCCGVCTLSVKDIHEASKGKKGLESDLRQASNVKLYLTACGHLVCSNDLPNGGVPFHPDGDLPRTCCPVCLREKDDDQPITLYSIYNADEGLYHPDIPDTYFALPEEELDRSDSGLKWQYITLLRNSKAKHAKIAQLQRNMEDATRRLEAQQTKLHQFQEQISDLEARNADLEGKWQGWKRRLPAITQYLGAFRDVLEENAALRSHAKEIASGIPDIPSGRINDPRPDFTAQERITDAWANLNVDQRANQVVEQEGAAHKNVDMRGQQKTSSKLTDRISAYHPVPHYLGRHDQDDQARLSPENMQATRKRKYSAIDASTYEERLRKNRANGMPPPARPTRASYPSQVTEQDQTTLVDGELQTGGPKGKVPFRARQEDNIFMEGSRNIDEQPELATTQKDNGAYDQVGPIPEFPQVHSGQSPTEKYANIRNLYQMKLKSGHPMTPKLDSHRRLLSSDASYNNGEYSFEKPHHTYRSLHKGLSLPHLNPMTITDRACNLTSRRAFLALDTILQLPTPHTHSILSKQGGLHTEANTPRRTCSPDHVKKYQIGA